MTVLVPGLVNLHELFSQYDCYTKLVKCRIMSLQADITG